MFGAPGANRAAVPQRNARPRPQWRLSLLSAARSLGPVASGRPPNTPPRPTRPSTPPNATGSPPHRVRVRPSGSPGRPAPPRPRERQAHRHSAGPGRQVRRSGPAGPPPPRDRPGARLVEGNTWGDTHWGIGRGPGRNEFGKLLMCIGAGVVDHDPAALMGRRSRRTARKQPRLPRGPVRPRP